MNVLTQVAKDDGCEEILDSFRQDYLLLAIKNEASLATNKNLTAQERAGKVLENLKAATSALKKSNELHGNIDRAHFEEIVRSDNFLVSAGVDKKKGRKLLFMRTGMLFKGIWRYKVGTPRGNAFVAAVDFLLMAALANIPGDAKGDGLQLILVSDLSEAGCLDFNPSVQLRAFELYVAFGNAVPALILFSGVSTFTRAMIRATFAVVPADLHENIILLSSTKEIEEYVDASDLPHWWYKEKDAGLSARHDPADMRNTWKLDSLFGENGGPTMEDIWFPGPWLQAVQKRKSLSALERDTRYVLPLITRTSKGRLLESIPSLIEEGEEEEE